MKPLSRLICVAALLGYGTARADSSAKIAKGPYLQALGPTSVEIRAELDPSSSSPSSISVKVAGADGGVAGTSHEEIAGAMHIVRIGGLAPSTHYSYSFSAGPAVAKGEFTTAPPTDSREPFTVLVYGDNRTDPAAHAAIVRAMLQSPSDFVVNTGDVVEDGRVESDWQSFFDIEAPLLRDRAVFTCIGNHELVDGASAGYLRYFGPTSDAHGENEKPKLYGSFRWADARFFLLDAMESFESGPERTWLEAELARTDAEPGLVWRIVVMHHSPWSSGPHGGNPRAIRAGLPSLLSSHHVDLILAGHDHIYERGLASGLPYVVSGGGGAPLYDVGNLLPSTRKAVAVHHFVELTVGSDAIRLVARRDDGTIIERCGLPKAAAREGWDCDPVAALPSKSDPPPPATPAATKCACDGAGTGTRGSLQGLAALAMLCGIALVRRRPNRG